MTADRFIELARAIADGGAVDFSSAQEATTTEKDRRVVHALQMLARIREFSAPPDQTTPVEAPLPRSWGNVTLLESLGSGSFGTVYRAVDNALGLNVAIKILTPRDGTERTRILEEGRRLARLRHGNIVRVYGIDTHEDAIGLRMELVAGRTLDVLVREEGPAPERDAAGIGMSVCRAVGAIHTANLLHRDIKASNVLREDTGRVVVTDLGAGVDMETLRSRKRTDRLSGTPMYLAPEVLNGTSPSVASDVYAIGVLLFFLVSGEYPISATELDDVWNAHRRGAQRSLSDTATNVSARFERLVGVALARDPADRFTSTVDLAEALSVCLEETAETELPARDRRGASTPNNVPRSLSRFVGRDAEIQRAVSLLGEGRVLTLVGGGGCGKTRLATELATRALSTSRSGVWFCDLTLVEAPDDVVRKVASEIHVRETEGEPVLDAIIRFLAPGRSLLVLDNSEHVLEGVTGFVSELQRQCPTSSVLATSRTPLGLATETLLDVPPLPVPDAAQPMADVRTNDAVHVFLSGARRVRPSFELTEANLPHIVSICRALDGIPLALELAAGGLRAFSPAAIAKQVRDALPTGRQVNPAQPHHETLRAAIDWSLALVAPQAATLFERLSVCVGGWNLDLAETLAPPGANATACLSALVNASLVETRFAADDGTGDGRYRMLEPVRLLAAERLGTEADFKDARARHRVYVADLTHAAARELRGADQAYWLSRLTEDHANLSHAVRTSVADNDPDIGCRIVFAASRYWYVRGHWTEARSLVTPLVELKNGLSTEAGRANAFNVLANLASFQGDNDAARSYYDKGLAIRRTLGDDAALASSLNDVGVHAHHQGLHADALAYLEESLDIRRRLDNRPGLAQVLNNIGSVTLMTGDYARARSVLEECLTIREELGDRWGVGVANLNLGRLDASEDRLDDAIGRFEMALAIHEPLGERWGVGIAHANLCAACRRTGRSKEAWSHAIDAVRILTDLGDRAILLEVVVTCAGLAVASDALDDAGTLLGYADRLLTETKTTLSDEQRTERDAATSALRERHDAAAIDTASRRGKRLSGEALLALVERLATSTPEA